MPIQNDSLNRKLYNLLNARGYNPVPRDSDVSNAGKTVPPEEADVFKFTFKQGKDDIDDAWVTIDGAQNLILYYDQDLADKASERTPGTQFDDSWYGLLNHLKKWSHSRQLSFKLEPKEKIDSDMAQRTYMKKKEQIAEGYYPMGKTASYSDAVPTVKIILQHSRQIQEGEQRYRNVSKIFLENAEGERFLSPTNKPGLAQVYARHLAEGGVPNDERWNHLKSLCEEYSQMAGFVRAVRNNQFNESAQRLVNEGLNHYQGLRESLSKLRGSRGYNTYFESWTPALMETEGDDQTNLNELFVQETLDPRIESVIPILNKLSKNLGEMKEVSELAEWADSLIESPGAETLAHNQATEKSRLDAFDLDENDGGQQALNPVGIPEDDLDEGILDTVKKVGGKVLDKLGHGSDEDLLKDLQKKAGVRGPNHGKPSMAQSDVEKRVDEEDMDESALQAYLGDKKYGKDGMDALRKAGQEDASEKTMQNIRAKYSSKEDEVSEEVDMGQYDAVKSTPKGKEDDEVFKRFREKIRQYGDELGQRQGEKKEKEVDEGLDADQRRAGQWGPTGGPAKIGNLVGEGQEDLDALKRLLGK
jgi:phage terminase small subunit